jgi:hypothetical protein
MGLTTALFGSFCLILILIFVAVIAWRLFIVLVTKGIDSVRDQTQVDRVISYHDRLQYLIELQRQRDLERKKNCFTDLSGKRIYLTTAEQQIFRGQCLQVLGLSAELTPKHKMVRSHWRKSVIKWHPDQGGDSKQWLIRLRAYEALMAMQD